jgi:hypothetical protein
MASIYTSGFVFYSPAGSSATGKTTTTSKNSRLTSRLSCSDVLTCRLYVIICFNYSKARLAAKDSCRTPVSYSLNFWRNILRLFMINRSKSFMLIHRMLMIVASTRTFTTCWVQRRRSSDWRVIWNMLRMTIQNNTDLSQNCLSQYLPVKGSSSIPGIRDKKKTHSVWRPVFLSACHLLACILPMRLL